MRSEIQVFSNEMFGNLRVYVSEDGKYLFNLADVSRALSIGNPSDLKRRLPERGVVSIETPTKNQFGSTVIQRMTYVDEPNLYRCIFRSQKAEATKFQNWVFDEVLPQIRKTGGYVPIKEEDDEKTILSKALLICQRTIDQKNAFIEQQKPKVEYCDDCLKSEDCVTTSQIAKEFGMSAIRLNNILHELGIQFKQSGQWFLYAKFAKMGFAKERTAPYFDSQGKCRTAITMVWTEPGKRFVSELVRNDYDIAMALSKIKD